MISCISYQRPLRAAAPSRLLLLLLWACATLAGAAELEVIRDNNFRRGFVLWEPKPGKHIKYGEIRGLETNVAPVWGLSQWSSRFPIQPVAQRTTEGSLVFSNDVKSITLQVKRTSRWQPIQQSNLGRAPQGR